MMNSDHLPATDIVLVSGFLGAGKTTLIDHWLAGGLGEFGKVALIVNEVGEVGVDGTLLSGRGVDMVELASGCICCTLRAEFSKAVREILPSIRPDLLVVEASGVARPGEVLEGLKDPDLAEATRLAGIITVVNADTFRARKVFGPFFENQIREAQVLLLNKVDLVDTEHCEQIERELRRLNPAAAIYRTRYCRVGAEVLPAAGRPVGAHHPDRTRTRRGAVDKDIESLTFRTRRPMARGRLLKVLESLPDGLYRAKGWVALEDGCARLDYAGGRFRLEPAEGGRQTALSLVGRKNDLEETARRLEECTL